MPVKDKQLLVSGFKYHVLPVASPQQPDLQHLQDDLYDFWHQQWLATFGELEDRRRLYSDDFLRQSESTFLTYQDKIVSYFSFSFFNLNLKSHRGHSYFKPYPPNAIDKLRQLGLSNVMTMGYLTVAPEWRKTVRGVLVAEILVGMAYKRFLQSNASTLIAYTRNDRKANELAYLYGSKCLFKDWKAHNVIVDVVYTLRNETNENPEPFLRAAIQDLWANRIIYHDKVKAPIKKVA